MLENEKETRKGRPALSHQKKEEMRQRIASIAADLFRREGFEAISMRRLAQEAGCTAMSLYQFYPNKFAVLQTLWDQIFKNLFDGIQALPASGDPRTHLSDMCVYYVDYWCQNESEYRLVFMSGDVSQKDVGSFMDNSGIVSRYGIFQSAIAAVIGPKVTHNQIALHFEWLFHLLHGMAHNRITISAYPWHGLRDLVEFTIRKIS